MKLRGHHLLCLQGFKGLGYNENFVRQMKLITKKLKEAPDTHVILETNPDDICQACPHNQGKCTNRLPHQKPISDRDIEVLKRLGISQGATIPYNDILGLIKNKIKPEDLADICQGCPWIDLGYCKEGIALLGKSWSY